MAKIAVPFYDAAASFVGIPKLRYLEWTRQVRKLVAEIQPDIMHAHFINSGGWLAAATGFHPLVMTAHGSDLLLLNEQGYAQQFLTRQAVRRADYVHCVSADLAAAALRYGVPHERIGVIPLGVDLSIFAPDQTSAAEIPESLESLQGPLILHLRALQPIYNPLAVARAIPKVLRQIPEARFAILTHSADPSLMQEFVDTVEADDALDAVLFLPSLTNDAALASVYARADVAISVARSDGQPLSVLEAMACDTALVLGDIPAFRGWVRHEEEALLVTANDGNAIAEAVIRLLGDQHLRRTLARQARVYTDKHADRNRTLANLEQIYTNLIHQSDSG